MPDTVRLPNLDARPVIAAIRFDQQGRQCLRQALLRAVHTSQPAIALHIVQETGRTLGFYRRHDHGEVLRPNVDVARSLLADFSAELVADIPGGAAAHLHQIVVPGIPERRIVEVARLTEAELIVIGGRQKKGLDRLLACDVSGVVLRHAPCPVLMVDADGQPLGEPGSRLRRRERQLPSGVHTR